MKIVPSYVYVSDVDLTLYLQKLCCVMLCLSQIFLVVLLIGLHQKGTSKLSTGVYSISRSYYYNYRSMFGVSEQVVYLLYRKTSI